MKVQLIEDNNGKATGVFIPIKDWQAIKKRYKDLEQLEEDSSIKLLLELQSAIKQLNQVNVGKIKARPIKALLDDI